MTIQIKKRTIDGIEYQVTQLGAKEGRAVLVRLTKMLGPTFAKFAEAARELTLTAEAFGTGGDIGEANVAALVPAIERLVSDVSESELDYLCETFGARSCYREGTAWPELDRHFDMHFAGAYMRMIKWLAFSIEVNYADFFDAFKTARAKAEAVARAKVRPSESPTA